jgi:O-antigen/teichoic acid export membrane protein
VSAAALSVLVAVSAAGLFASPYAAVVFPRALGPVPTTALFSAMFMAQLMTGWLASLLAGKRQFAAMASVNVSTAALLALGFGALLVVAQGRVSILHVLLVGLFVESVKVPLFSYWIFRNSESPVDFVSGEARIRELVLYSGISFAADLVQFLNYRVDVWILNVCADRADLGVYGVAVTLAQIVWALPTAIAQVLFAHVPTMERAAGARLAVVASKAALLGCSVLGFAGVGLSYALVPLIYGRDFHAAPHMIAILLLGVVPYSMVRVLSGYLGGLGLVRTNLATGVVGLLVCIALDALLIPRFGAYGASWASAASYVCFTGMTLVVFARKTGTPMRQLVSFGPGTWRELRQLRARPRQG